MSRPSSFKKYADDPIKYVIPGVGSPRSATAYQIKAKAEDIMEKGDEYRSRISQGRSAEEVSRAKGELLGSFVASHPPHPSNYTPDVDMAAFKKKEAEVQKSLKDAMSNLDALGGLLSATAPGAAPSAPKRYSRFSKPKK
jgi:hypothetical protein